MFISKIILENFQAFERGEFDLSPNLNILVGISNVGKSSVARALSLILFNQWDKSWVKFGAKYCRVMILTNTGIEVIREKGDKINRYILRLPGQPEQLFESFGTVVPEQIQQALKIHAVPVDMTDMLNLNLAGQMDSLFLLSQTGSYRAKVLGKLSGAAYLDHAIRGLNNDKRKVTEQKNSMDLEVIKFKEQVDKFSAIEAYTEVISNLDVKLTSLVVAQQRVERIKNLLERMKAIKDSHTRLKAKEAILHTLDTNLIDDLFKRIDNIKGLKELVLKINKLRPAYLKESNIEELVKSMDLSGINRLAEKVTNFRAKEKLALNLLDTLGLIHCVTMDLKQAQSNHADVTKQYADKLREAGVCPICNRSTEDSCVQ